MNKLKKKHKGIRNLFSLWKENKPIKDEIIRDIRNPFEHEEKDYYKPVRGKFWSNNYIECKSKSDRKIMSAKKYINKIRAYLKDIISNL